MKGISAAGDRLGISPRTDLSVSTVLIAVVVFMVMAGFDTDNALQLFEDPLGSALDTIQEGSLARRMAMVLLAGWAVVSLVRTGVRRVRFDPIVALPLLSFLVLAAASPLWAVDRDLTLRRVILLALLVLGAFALAERAGVVGLAKLTLVVTAIIVALAVIAQVYLGSFRPFDGGWRLAGIMHPVALSWYCGLGAIASIALSRQFPGRRGVLLTATAVFLATLVLTRTRTGIAGALVGIAALWFLSDRKKLRQRLAVTSVVLGLMLFGAILASAYGLTWSATYGSFVDITSLGREDALDQFSTFSGRLPIWVASLQLAAERPLLGYGYNAFSSPELLGEFARTVGWVPTSTHSGYFEALLSLGAIGLALFATLIAAGIRASLLMVSRRPEQAFTVAVLLWLGVNLVFEAPVFFDPIFVAGLSYALLMDIGFFSITSLTSEVVTQ